MIDLQFVGYTADLKHLVFDLVAGSGEGRYRLLVDADLYATLDVLRDARREQGLPVGDDDGWNDDAWGDDAYDDEGVDDEGDETAQVTWLGDDEPESDQAEPVDEDSLDDELSFLDASSAAKPPVAAPGNGTVRPAAIRRPDPIDEPVEPPAPADDPPAPHDDVPAPPDEPNGPGDDPPAPGEAPVPADGLAAAADVEPALPTDGTSEFDAEREAAIRARAARPGFASRDGDGPSLTPLEIQSLLRRGKSVKAVAKAANTTVDWVENWVGPIEAEREQILRAARRLRLERARLGRSQDAMGAAVERHLRDKGVAAEDVSWEAVRHKDGRWRVTAAYTHRRRRTKASWLYDPHEGTLEAANDAGKDLGFTRRKQRA